LTHHKFSKATTRSAALVIVLLGSVGYTAVYAQDPKPQGPSTKAPANPQAPWEVRGAHGMVVSANAYSSKVGADVLKAGGNAVDAAIATGFALAVTYPTAGNIGGGGFMVIRFPDGKATTFDFREKAPLKSSPEMFLNEKGEYSFEIHHASHRSVGVPGTVAGFAKAHKSYGKLKWDQLVAPAVALASDGFIVTPGLARSLAGNLPAFRTYPATVQSFARNDSAYKAGETLRQPDLARTLQRIADKGRDGFYKGETARLIAEEMQRGNGVLTEEDLAKYEAKERAPLRGTYRGYEIITMPPPSSGGIALIEMLNILEGYDLVKLDLNTAAYIHTVTEAMRRAYLDRARYDGDADFVKVPIERLTSKKYAAALRKTIDPVKATPSTPMDIELAYESPQTTHYSVVDADGMAVSVTYTLEAGYGSKITVPGAGFLLNNEMGDFNAKPGVTDTTGLIGTTPNLAQPGKRMLSSMTPTILVKDGQLFEVVGSPGGRTIINTVMEVILNSIDFDMPLGYAVSFGRFHHQWLPDEVLIEKAVGDAHLLNALLAMGHPVRRIASQGTAHSIRIDLQTGERIGVADYRDTDASAIGN
jgi:gamma-glutamyltranspeptidase/glutathione hydrolase